jgi:hypothetical protein
VGDLLRKGFILPLITTIRPVRYEAFSVKGMTD